MDYLRGQERLQKFISAFNKCDEPTVQAMLSEGIKYDDYIFGRDINVLQNGMRCISLQTIQMLVTQPGYRWLDKLLTLAIKARRKDLVDYLFTFTYAGYDDLDAAVLTGDYELYLTVMSKVPSDFKDEARRLKSMLKSRDISHRKHYDIYGDIVKGGSVEILRNYTAYEHSKYIGIQRGLQNILKPVLTLGRYDMIEVVLQYDVPLTSLSVDEIHKLLIWLIINDKHYSLKLLLAKGLIVDFSLLSRIKLPTTISAETMNVINTHLKNQADTLYTAVENNNYSLAKALVESGIILDFNRLSRINIMDPNMLVLLNEQLRKQNP
jgi:hypothetical protein